MAGQMTNSTAMVTFLRTSAGTPPAPTAPMRLSCTLPRPRVRITSSTRAAFSALVALRGSRVAAENSIASRTVAVGSWLSACST